VFGRVLCPKLCPSFASISESFSVACDPRYSRSIEDLRKKPALPKVAKRLPLIEKMAEKEKWPGQPGIGKRIDAIEKLAQSE
jgi:hypothetical protein